MSDIPLGADQSRAFKVESRRLDLDLSRAQVRLIDEIRTQGLKSSAQLIKEQKLFLGAKDSWPNPRVYWASFDAVSPPTESSDSLDRRLGRVLYWTSHSVLPVMAERLFDHLPTVSDSATKDIVQKRINGSFVAVIKNPDEQYSKFTNNGNYDHNDPRLDHVGTEHLLVLLVPQVIVQSYKRLKGTLEDGGVPIREVGYITRTVIDANGRSVELEVPDYESAILELSRNVGGKIGISGIRLPVDQEDLDYLRGKVPDGYESNYTSLFPWLTP